jgi:hypothetical protein
MSIIAVSNITTPQPHEFGLNDAVSLAQAMGGLFNFTAANLPIESSIVYPFLDIRTSKVSEADWAVEASKTLQNSLAYNLWFFNTNFYGNPNYKNLNERGLPSEFNTVASLCQPSTRFIVDKLMLKAYVALQIIPILFSWVVYIWILITGLPTTELSSFALLDFVFKTDMVSELPLREELMNAGDAKMLEVSEKVVVRGASGRSPEKLE